MKEKTEIERGVKPPYISQHIWEPFFTKMRHVSRPKLLSYDELKRYGMTSVPALQSALKFLGLIDDKANPTEQFGLIQSEGEKWKKGLESLIRTAYKDLLEKHPLPHARYEDLVNYFGERYSGASKKKMAKSFAVLCKMAGLESPAFLKMRSLDKPDEGGQRSAENRTVKAKQAHPAEKKSSRLTGASDQEEIVKEFIKTNPMPTGVQWDANTLKEYFNQYRNTIRMLKGEESKEGD